MKHAAYFIRCSGPWCSVALLGLGLVSATCVLLILVMLQVGSVTGVIAGLGATALLSLAGMVLISLRMVSRSEQARQTEEEAHRYLQEIMDTLPTGVAIYDEQDRLVAYNRAAAELYPYRSGIDLIGHTYETLLRRSLQSGCITNALGREEAWLQQRLASRGRMNAPMLCATTDGRWMQFYDIRTPSRHLVMVRTEVTDLVEKSRALEHSNEELSHLSLTDALTGLANRRMFDQCLHSEWQRSARSQQPLSLIMIDIDHFKRYNDHYGHPGGDACLRRIAALLFDCSQRSGEVVARYGGEEFVLLLPSTSSHDAKIVAQRCMDELRLAKIPHADSPCAPMMTFSMGVATVIADAQQSPEGLLSAADSALYRAKAAGRSRNELASADR